MTKVIFCLSVYRCTSHPGLRSSWPRWTSRREGLRKYNQVAIIIIITVVNQYKLNEHIFVIVLSTLVTEEVTAQIFNVVPKTQNLSKLIHYIY